MSGHTPGPWDRAYREQHSYGDAITIYGGGSRPVALIPSRGALRVEEAEREADANLIAAAPELLSAIHTLRKLYGAIADDLTMNPKYPWESAPQAYKDTWRAVRDLIAKVERRRA